MTTFTTSLTNPLAAGSEANPILQSVEAAANQWSAYIQGAGTVAIDITIGDVGDAIATGGSSFISTNGGLYAPDPVVEIQTGTFPSGDNPDIQITLSPNFVNNLFYDPSGTGTVPVNQADAVSVFEHEIGHGLGINYVSSSTYSQFVTTIGASPYFTGPNAEAAYGGMMPLDSTESHVTFNDLMNPVANGGTRETISGVDLGILQDVGVPIATDRADKITLGSADTVFSGLGGDDMISAGNGNNLLYGNQGSDTISAGNGNNTIVGGQDSTDGADVLTSGSGNDLILGNGGDDTIAAGGGADSVIGGFGNDVLLGNQGNDLLLGNLGDDKLYGGLGDDTIYGGQGNDTIFGNAGNDLMFGGTGSNTFVFNPGDSNFVSGDGVGDVIADFKSGSDTLRLTQAPAATAQTFGTASVAPSSFAAIQATAQTLINAGDSYAFVTDGTNGYLFADENGDKSLDDAIKLSGAATTSSLKYQDIAVGAIA